MRRLLPPIVLVVAAGCAGTPKAPRAAMDADVELGVPVMPMEATTRAASSSDAHDAPCLVVQGDLGGQPATVDGVLASTKGASTPLVLRLTHPRCIVGLAHAAFITEVYVASTGVDLRPFIDTRIRVTGDLIGGTNDLGGPAVVVLAKDIERAVREEPR